MGGLGVKVQHFPLTLLVVLTTLTLPCERDQRTHSAYSVMSKITVKVSVILAVTVGYRRRSSVNFLGKIHFCSKVMYEKLTKFPNFT